MSKTMMGFKRIRSSTEREARHAAANYWATQLTRLGYIVRGVIYAIPGLLALQLALGRGGGNVDQTGAIQVIGNSTYGKTMLILVAIGLLGYTIWGLVRAFFDPLRRGDDAMGLAERLGFIVSAAGYASLLLVTIGYIRGATISSGTGIQDWSAKLLSVPGGRLLVALIGVGWIVGGAWQIYQALHADFNKDWKTRTMSRREKELATLVGRIGIPARGVVFAMIGLFLVESAINANPSDVRGFDGALLVIAQQPLGPWLLGIVALGLIAFGIHSILGARWIRVEVKNKPKSK
jgi:hypothetical protein